MNGLTEFKVGARTAALGLRFWDPIASAFVGDGLRVIAYPVVDPSRRVAATTNLSRGWVFHKLPGMAAFEHGEGDEAFWKAPFAPRPDWKAPGQPRDYVIEVDDEKGRFVPFQLTVTAPAREAWEWVTPPGVTLAKMPPGAIPLFSAATRAVPQGMAVIRAELWDATAGKPAAWAVVTAQIDGVVGIFGMADEKGRVALVFPNPAPVGEGVDSLTGVALTDQTWPVALAVGYAPAWGAGKVPVRAVLPGVLTQAAGTLWGKWDEADPAARAQLAAGTLILAYGAELVVRTVASGSPGTLVVTGAP